VDSKAEKAADRLNTSDDSLQVLSEELTDEEQIQLLFGRLSVKGKLIELVNKQITRSLGKPLHYQISMKDFCEYMRRLKAQHSQSCGETCSHLKRFYARLGFV